MSASLTSGAGGAIADLLDLQSELSSLQKGLSELSQQRAQQNQKVLLVWHRCIGMVDGSHLAAPTDCISLDPPCRHSPHAPGAMLGWCMLHVSCNSLTKLCRALEPSSQVDHRQTHPCSNCPDHTRNKRGCSGALLNIHLAGSLLSLF